MDLGTMSTQNLSFTTWAFHLFHTSKRENEATAVTSLHILGTHILYQRNRKPHFHWKFVTSAQMV